MIRRAIDILQRRGINVLIRAAISRLRGSLAGQAKSFGDYRHLFVGKSGLEIGGPSAVFSEGGMFPVYPVVQLLDNCNYSTTTVWSGDSGQTTEFQFDPKKQSGRQFIGEATSLSVLVSDSYDFVLSSHMLEHTANPVLALTEWKRILKPHGTLVLILPNPKYTFDHRRPVTTLSHLIADFEAAMSEEDLTHREEILALHDFQRDPDADDPESFRLRSLRNFENRCLHHHVFDESLARELLQYVGLKVGSVEEVVPHHIVLLTMKETSSDIQSY